MRLIMSEQMTQESITYDRYAVRNAKGQFVEGAPNLFGRERKVIENTLRRVVAQNAGKVRRACDRLLDIAADDPDPRNAMAAFSLIADRLDGKAVARIETTNGDARSLGMAELLTAILQARASSATDAIDHTVSNDSTDTVNPSSTPSDTPPGTPDIPIEPK